jgi:glycosyltransferase involved in cell wall biosynthesis
MAAELHYPLAMRIVHVETGRHLYGGAQQVLYLLRGLRGKTGVENLLVCPRGSAIAEVAQVEGVPVAALAMSGDLDPAFAVRLFRHLRRVRPDLVHLHSRRGADWQGGLAARAAGIPCLLTRRVDNPEPRPVAAVKYRLYDRIIAISEGIRTVLLDEGVPATKVVTVRSAVDTAPWQAPGDRAWFQREFGLAEGELAVGVIAQLIGRKGHRFLLEAMPAILAAAPRARFLFLGRGPAEAELRAMARKLKVEPRVLFAGFRDDLPRVMGNLALVVHPALMEGLGVSLLQAAAAGVPIVGARAGGVPEVVRDGVNGLLVDPGDIPALGRAVTSLLLDTGRSRAMGEAGREMAIREFSVPAMVEGNLHSYREVLSDARETGKAG